MSKLRLKNSMFAGSVDLRLGVVIWWTSGTVGRGAGSGDCFCMGRGSWIAGEASGVGVTLALWYPRSGYTDCYCFRVPAARQGKIGGLVFDRLAHLTIRGEIVGGIDGN
jgi:hypothetical protein